MWVMGRGLCFPVGAEGRETGRLHLCGFSVERQKHSSGAMKRSCPRWAVSEVVLRRAEGGGLALPKTSACAYVGVCVKNKEGELSSYVSAIF